MVVLKIAFRNLREHKSKTLIIGTLIAMGIAFLVIANSLMATITRGMQASFVENYSGDLIVHHVDAEDTAFIGGFGEASAILENYSELAAALEAMPEVDRFSPLLAATARLGQDGKTLSVALLWGIEPGSYFAMFPDSFVLSDGEYLRDGEEGVLLAQSIVDTVREEHGVELTVGDAIQLSAQNDVTGTKIRTVTIRGIGRFENAAGIGDRVSFVDAQTLRALEGLTAVRVDRPVRSEDAAPAPSEDALFGGGSPLVGATPVGPIDDGEETLDLDAILGDTSVREAYLALDNHAWHFLLLDVAAGTSPEDVHAALAAGEHGAARVAVDDWRWAAGLVADMALGVRATLSVIMVVIAVVAVVIIMNALVISVTERIGEIGTMRALGGQKAFVRSMITGEVLMITLVFGVVGMALGAAAVLIVGAVGIETENLYLQILFGGSTIEPVLEVSSLFTSLAVVAVIGVVASLYPASVALRIAPVEAMKRT